VSATDLLTAAIILGAAGALLWRSFARGKGPCHGCGGCASGREKKPQELVTLGSVRGRGR
jgi:hypothetical protein